MRLIRLLGRLSSSVIFHIATITSTFYTHQLHPNLSDFTWENARIQHPSLGGCTACLLSHRKLPAQAAPSRPRIVRILQNTQTWIYVNHNAIQFLADRTTCLRQINIDVTSGAELNPCLSSFSTTFFGSEEQLALPNRQATKCILPTGVLAAAFIRAYWPGIKVGQLPQDGIGAWVSLEVHLIRPFHPGLAGNGIGKMPDSFVVCCKKM